MAQLTHSKPPGGEFTLTQMVGPRALLLAIGVVPFALGVVLLSRARS